MCFPFVRFDYFMILWLVVIPFNVLSTTRFCRFLAYTASVWCVCVFFSRRYLISKWTFSHRKLIEFCSEMEEKKSEINDKAALVVVAAVLWWLLSLMVTTIVRQIQKLLTLSKGHTKKSSQKKTKWKVRTVWIWRQEGTTTFSCLSLLYSYLCVWCVCVCMCTLADKI